MNSNRAPQALLSASSFFRRRHPRGHLGLALLLLWVISWVLLSLQNQQGVAQAQNMPVATWWRTRTAAKSGATRR